MGIIYLYIYGYYLLSRQNAIITIFLFVILVFIRILDRDAGTTGAAGASAPLAFCIFNFVGVVRVQPVHKTFTTDRIKRRSRMCVGVFHPPSRQEFGKFAIHLTEGKTESITYGIFGEKLRRNAPK